MSIIEDSEESHVRMANLAVVAAYSVNGVAELHSKLLREGLFSDFHAMEPAKFNNKTNGVTHRRWLAGANPLLAALATKTIGDGWLTRPEELSRLSAFASDPRFQEEWAEVKRANKAKLVRLVSRDCGQVLDPDSLFDVQVKRIHEYKRQLLNLLHVVHLYAALKDGCVPDPVPRTVLIGGKAAPGYFMAKLVVSLACKVAETINADPGTRDLLRLVFLPDYRVTTMEVVSPAADLSEQISTAGKEASGTGNMKLMMNGALTIGTLDGANVEILDAVGEENFFLFGMTAPEAERARHGYDPEAIVSGDHDLRRAVELIASGHFNRLQPGLFDPILAALLSPSDPWLVAADFRSYLDAQKRAAAAFADKGRWAKMSILNSAASGRFSTDRTIREYNEGIWGMEPIPPLRGF